MMMARRNSALTAKLVVALLIIVCSCKPSSGQAPPFLLVTTPVPQIPIYTPPPNASIDCSGVNQGNAYEPWGSHLITPTTEIGADSDTFLNINNPSAQPIPQMPIECNSQTQLRVGSCTTQDDCISTMGGMVNPATECPSSLVCCVLPTCALIVGSKTRYGHCRPARTCPGIFDTVAGISVGCPDNASPCCVPEDASVTCPANYDRYADALVRSYSLISAAMPDAIVASPQRVLAWAPYLLSVFDPTVGMCVFDCHKVSFLQFVMNVFSEMFMFNSEMGSFYKQLIDWKGVSKGLLPESFFSYYSPSTFASVIRYLFENYQLEQAYGVRSFLSANRIFDMLNREIGVPLSDYTSIMTLTTWRSYKHFAGILGCAPIAMDGAECSQGQGMCFVELPAKIMNVSEYRYFCPAQLQLRTGDCDGYPFDKTACCAKPYPAIKYGAHLSKNEYNDIVIAIHQIHQTDPSLISDLVTTLTSASAAIYTATGGRAFFRTVTIVSQWNGTNGNASYENYKYADFKVLPDVIVQMPRAVQLGTCGEPGLGVFLSQNQLRQSGAAYSLAKMFALNRWGIGDEVAASMSETSYVPDDQVQGSASFKAASSCSAKVKVDYHPTLTDQKQYELHLLDAKPPSSVSFAFRPDLFPNENAEFCATTTMPHCDDMRRHNSEPNTPHNRICNRTSTLSAIFDSIDFAQTQNSPRFVGNTAPSFRFVRYPPITDLVIAIVADFSGSIPPMVGGTMLNALISFLNVAPDEVKLLLISVGPTLRVDIPPQPIAPLEPFVQPTGGLHIARQEMIETVKNWMRNLRSQSGPRNTSILTGVESLVDKYISKPNYRLKILVISDFMAVAPTDNRLLNRIRQAGYSVWPIGLLSRDKLHTVQQAANPLYNYMQALANATYGRWQLITSPTDMMHWYYALGTFLDDLDLGMTVHLEKYSLNVSLAQTISALNGSLNVTFNVPNNYALNTSIVVNYDSNLWPLTVNWSYNSNCSDDPRGYQKAFRYTCRVDDLSTTEGGKRVLPLRFAAKGNASAGMVDVHVWVVSRAIEYGAAGTGQNDLPDIWVDPWQNRLALSPEIYVKGEAKITAGTQMVFERSARFRFPKAYVILSSGKSAILNCYVEYDLYLSNSTFNFLKIVTNGRMYDDGSGEDGFANDGVYTALLAQATSNGSYTVHVRVKQSSDPTALGCYKKPSVAIVGFANNQEAIAAAPMTLAQVTFYKSAGSFDVVVPTEAANVIPLGLVQLHSCSASDVVPLPELFAPLPKSMKITCNVFPLAVATRYEINVTYYLSVSYQIADFTQHDRYGANASVLVTNSTKLDQQTDKSMTFALSFSLAQVLAPYYYVVVWASDGKGNYATRSEIRAIMTPPSQPSTTTLRNELPDVTDITTSFPRSDDILPTVIIFSCAAGGLLAMGLVITVAAVMKRRRSRKMWANDGNRVFLPSNWAMPVAPMQQHAPLRLQQRPDRPVVYPSGHQFISAYQQSLSPKQPPRSAAPNWQHVPTKNATWNHNHLQQQRHSQQTGSRQRSRTDAEIFFPNEMSTTMPSSRRSKTPTADRQNASNSKLQNFYYTRATDGVNRRF